jgi:hypothetical protein
MSASCPRSVDSPSPTPTSGLLPTGPSGRPFCRWGEGPSCYPTGSGRGTQRDRDVFPKRWPRTGHQKMAQDWPSGLMWGEYVRFHHRTTEHGDLRVTVLQYRPPSCCCLQIRKAWPSWCLKIDNPHTDIGGDGSAPPTSNMDRQLPRAGDRPSLIHDSFAPQVSLWNSTALLSLPKTFSCDPQPARAWGMGQEHSGPSLGPSDLHRATHGGSSYSAVHSSSGHHKDPPQAW